MDFASDERPPELWRVEALVRDIEHLEARYSPRGAFDTVLSRRELGLVASEMDYGKTKEVLAALEREGVRYAIFGAVALNFHGLARFTEDLALFIAPDRENIERLKRALRSASYAFLLKISRSRSSVRGPCIA